jgi:acyl carrier protein
MVVVARSFSSAPSAAFFSEKEIEPRVMSVIQSIRSCPDNVVLSAAYATDLGFDSMIRKELVGKFSDEFRVPLSAEDADGILTTVGATVKFFASHSKTR